MNWEEAKKTLDSLSFPDSGFKEINLNERHWEGEGRKYRPHTLKSFAQNLSPIGRNPVEAHYNVCPECSAGMAVDTRNKFLIMFDNAGGRSYKKNFIKNGNYFAT